MMDIALVNPLWGTWNIGKIIDAGSYGIVYEASQTVLNHTYTCAVKHISIPRDVSELYAVRKQLLTEDEDLLQDHFHAAAQAIMNEYDIQKQFADSRNFVHVYDILSIPKSDMPGVDLLIRMELLRSLDTRFPAEMLPEETETEVIRLGMDICCALKEMHACHYMHRDIKPQNILVSDDGAYKLADFGTVRKMNHEASLMSIRGTWDYIAPEAVTGKEVGFSSDLYSLGLVMYVLLNRRKAPFAEDSSTPGSDHNVLRFAGREFPAPVDASPETAEILQKACAYNPEDRYASAEDMFAALQALHEKRKENACPPDLPECLRDTFLRAAGGEASAQNDMGYCYYFGTNIQKDLTKAVRWYRKAAQQGHSGAQFMLGWCYFNGLGVEKDLTEGARWYRTSAEQGETGSMCYLAYCYANGQGVDKDFTEAVTWYRKAADLGHTGAMYNLAICYANGQGVEKDHTETVRWFRKAADLGDAGAMYSLGCHYYHGDGVQQDLAEAVRWFQKAAEQGDAGAQYRLGNCYEEGCGVQKSSAEAYKWYQKAADQGHASAKQRLSDLIASSLLQEISSVISQA